jgi:membrane protease YdiL (CAAX protease family)
MGKKHRLRSIALAIVKVVAFVLSIKFLVQLVFIPLGAFSARYWSRYDGRGLNEPWFLTSCFAILLVTLLVCFAFIKFLDKKDWSYIRLKSGKKFRLFVTGGVLSFAAVLAFVVVMVISGVIKIDTQPKPLENIVFYLALGFIGNFALVLNEELITRGYVLRTLENSSNAILAVIVSSLFFSLLHIFRPNTSLLAFVNIFLMGCFIASVCIHYNSLWAPFGLHLGWNYSLYLFNFPVSGHQYPNPIFSLQYNQFSLLSGSKFGPEDSVLVTILLVIVLAYFFVRFLKRARAFGQT